MLHCQTPWDETHSVFVHSILLMVSFHSTLHVDTYFVYKWHTVRLLPKLLWHILTLHHGQNHIKNGSVFPLSYTVLLWWVWGCQKFAYAVLLTVLHELCWCEIASPIRSNNLNVFVCLLFHHHSKILEHLRLFLQEVYLCLSWKIIYKRNKVSLTTKRFRGNWSTHVGMN